MKMIYAIVSNDDSHVVSSALTKAGFFATKIASTGGFLMAGNTLPETAASVAQAERDRHLPRIWWPISSSVCLTTRSLRRPSAV